MAMQQHPHYASTIEALGGRVTKQTFMENGRPLGQAQVVKRCLGPLKLAWIPRGPIWADGVEMGDKQEVLQHLRAQQPKCALRLITPNTSADTPLLRKMSYREVAPGQTFASLDLTLPAQARLTAQHRKWRNRLRHAQSCAWRYETRPFQPINDAPLLKLEVQQRRERRYRALPPSFTQAWATANRNAAQLFLAHDQNEMIAFVLILIHAPSASYHIGWSNTAGRHNSCHNALLWRASNWLAQRGIERFELGIVNPARMPGLTRFKTGIGARCHTTGPTMLARPQVRVPKLWPSVA
jgi:hypothetical protein